MATQEDVLKLIGQEAGPVNSTALASSLGVPHPELIDDVKEGYIVTEEGKAVVEHGSFEVRVTSLVPSGGIAKADLENSAEYKALGPAAAMGFQQAVKSKWLQPGKDETGAVRVKKMIEGVPADKTRHELQHLHELPAAALAEYTKRKLIVKQVIKSLNVSKGPNFSTTIKKRDADLTPEMLLDGSWRTRDFKQVNLDAMGAPAESGALHPLLKVRAEYREIFLELGFSEMPTNQFVESSFWNFDALFQPQQHPCRDMHDTFFVSEPSTAKLKVFDGELDPSYVASVKTTHSTGGFGSQGYGYDWQECEAKKNILRTHTTAISAQMLYRLARECEGKEFRPVKLFSIDRVFRNESLDATHLAEFHQIEGVIADYNLTLGDLMGVLSAFFERLGMGGNLRFKPAYNPYTEPSMEVFSYHPGLGKLVEVGNSGVFRPEMLRPMGLPEDVVVIAWGLSLERPTMIKYGYDNIRDLVGPKVDLEMVHTNPICRI